MNTDMVDVLADIIGTKLVIDTTVQHIRNALKDSDIEPRGIELLDEAIDAVPRVIHDIYHGGQVDIASDQGVVFTLGCPNGVIVSYIDVAGLLKDGSIFDAAPEDVTTAEFWAAINRLFADLHEVSNKASNAEERNEMDRLQNYLVMGSLARFGKENLTRLVDAVGKLKERGFAPVLMGLTNSKDLGEIDDATREIEVTGFFTIVPVPVTLPKVELVDGDESVETPTIH